MALEVGAQLGHYEVTAKIGEGGMGEVWQATDTKLNRPVALKILPEAFASDPDRLARFQREAQVLASLNHPGIAAIYGIEEANDTRALVLELVEGPTMADRIAQGPIPVGQALPIAEQIAEAVEAAHEQGVIHRDLKPANIKLKPDGTVKVLDFGLAKALDMAPDGDPSQSPTLTAAATQMGVIMGTAAYMSPEQAAGQSVDRRSDIWAFGVVFYEMLAGQRLFGGDSVPQVIARVLERTLDFRLLPAATPPGILRLLRRCLERNPKQRLQHIGDARVEIDAALVGDEEDDQITVPASGARRPLATLWRVAAAGVTGALLAGGVAWALWPTEPLPVVRSVLSAVERPPALGAGRDVAISPDGSLVAYRTPGAQGVQLVLRHLDQLEGTEVVDTTLGINGPVDLFFSPDGQAVGFISSRSRSVEWISVRGGPTVPVFGPIGTIPRGSSWGPDGTIIFASEARGLLRLAAAIGGEPDDLTPDRVAGEGYFWPQVLPGGGAVLHTTVTPEGSQVALLDLETLERVVLIPSGGSGVYVPSGHLVYAVDDVLWAVAFDLGRHEVVGDPVPVLEGVAAFPALGESAFAIADNGSLVYVTQVGPVPTGGERLENLLLTHVDRSGNRQVLQAPPRPYAGPRVSPDGARVALEVVEDGQVSLWVYELDGGAAIRRLTQVTEGNNTRPVWTTDGVQIAFTSDRDGSESIYWQPADGSGPAERLTTPEAGAVHLPYSWSPEGVLVFEVRREGGPATGELWTRDSEGNESLFYDVPGHQFAADFSPDGRWLAYTSLENSTDTREFRVFVGAYPGHSPRYEIAGNGAAWPVWSADGTELFFRLSATLGIPALNSVRIETSPTFRFTPEESFQVEGFSVRVDRRDFDVLPDGSGFIMLEPADVADDGDVERPDPQVVLVQNWTEELKRLVPVP